VFFRRNSIVSPKTVGDTKRTEIPLSALVENANGADIGKRHRFFRLSLRTIRWSSQLKDLVG
jgi:hypothetical protein